MAIFFNLGEWIVTKTIVALLFVLVILMAGRFLWAKDKPKPKLMDYQDDKYRPGQVWSYHSRPKETLSTVTILKTEKLIYADKEILVIHIRLDGLKIPNANAKSGVAEVLEHAPITRDALDKSVIKLLKKDGPIPNFDGYKQWRDDNGGVFTVTVAEIVSSIENGIKQNS